MKEVEKLLSAILEEQRRQTELMLLLIQALSEEQEPGQPGARYLDGQ